MCGMLSVFFSPRQYTRSAWGSFAARELLAGTDVQPVITVKESHILFLVSTPVMVQRTWASGLVITDALQKALSGRAPTNTLFLLKEALSLTLKERLTRNNSESDSF